MNHFRQIRSKLADFGLDAMLITCEANRLYASGFHTMADDGVTLITREKSYYFIDSRYIEEANSKVAEAQITLADSAHSYTQLLTEVISRESLSVIGFEEEYLTVAEYERYREKLPCTLKGATALLTALRESKDAQELAAITAAQRICERVFTDLCAELRPGVSEREISARIHYLMLHYGAEDKSFDPIVVSGPNTSLPHGAPGLRTLEAGDFVTMDFGCTCEGYCSDMTRTVAISHATDEMKTVYAAVLAAQQAAIAAARAGISGATLDKVARDVIVAAGYGDYFHHNLGHGVGVEIHEAPSLGREAATLLPVGTVVTAEPGIYLPGRFGVRIEDMLVLEAEGCRNLTLAPKELLIL